MAMCGFGVRIVEFGRRSTPIPTRCSSNLRLNLFCYFLVELKQSTVMP